MTGRNFGKSAGTYEEQLAAAVERAKNARGMREARAARRRKGSSRRPHPRTTPEDPTP